MKVKWLIAAVIAGSLAVPVAASAHPLESNLGVFSGQLPELEPAGGRGRPRLLPRLAAERVRQDGQHGVRRLLGPPGRRATCPWRTRTSPSRASAPTRARSRASASSTSATRRSRRRSSTTTDCRHPSGQGDVVIYGDIMTRSWDSASSNGMPAGGWPCGDTRVQAGEEGLHVFDVGDPKAAGRREVHRPAVRLAHRERRAGSGQRPPDRLQHAVERLMRRHRRHRDPVRRPVGGLVPPLRARRPT